MITVMWYENARLVTQKKFWSYWLRQLFITKNYFWPDRASSHTGLMHRTIRTSRFQFNTELLKLSAFPSFFNCTFSDIDRPTHILIIKTAWHHLHIRWNICWPSCSFTCIHAGRINIVCSINKSRYRTGIKTNLISTFIRINHTNQFR